MRKDVEELEDKLSDVGKRLALFPDDDEELSDLLDQIEILLSDVGQSPTKSMLNCLRPIMDALVDEKLLAHSDADMKVSVISCISELTRIFAPIGPYDGKDDIMKEVFKRIVETFANLDDISSFSFTRRVAILLNFETVRLCLMMLDLECDDLVLEMFRHFLNTIRPIHSESIRASMVSIMTLALDESDEISRDLISCLLGSVRNKNKENLILQLFDMSLSVSIILTILLIFIQKILPAARELGKMVIKNCENTLKPYVKLFLQSRGESLKDYSPVVSSIFQKKSEASKPKNITSRKAMEVVSSSQTSKKVPKGHSNLDEGPKNTSGRKHGPAAKEVSETTKCDRKLDGSLVGAKVKIWWPEDEQYYDGIIESFDSHTKKHKVVYTDGDVEILLLKNEQWDFIDDVNDKKLENEKGIISLDAPAVEARIEADDKKAVASDLHVIKSKTGVLKVRRPQDSSTISKKSKGFKTMKDCTTKTVETSMKVVNNLNNSIKPGGNGEKEDAGHSGIKNRKEVLKPKRSEENSTPNKKSKSIQFPKDGTTKTVVTSMKAGSNLDNREGAVKIKLSEDNSMPSEKSKGSKSPKPDTELKTNCASGEETHKVQQI